MFCAVLPSWNRASSADGRPTPDELATLRHAVASVSVWWHSIELCPGVVTPGRASLDWLAAHWKTLDLEPLEGKSVLDIDARDGYYSFEAERAGAGRVVALDYRLGSGEPGQRGFDLAHRTLGSGVQTVVADLTEVDSAELGRFDVVLCLGVLHQLEDPLGGLRRIAALTEDVAVIETAAIVVPGYERSPLWRFCQDDSRSDDAVSWWVPNEAAVHALCGSAGFVRVQTLAPPHPRDAVPGELIGLSRLTCRAWVR